MTIKTQWWFDTKGAPSGDANTAKSGISVRVQTRLQAIAEAETLQPQVKAIYASVLATIKDPPTTAAVAAKRLFTMKEGDAQAQEADKKIQERDLVFFAHLNDGDDRELSPVGFSQIFELAYYDVVFGTALIVDLGLSLGEQDSVVTALFHATQSVGEAMVQELLIEKRTGTNPAVADLPTAKIFARSTMTASDFAKKLLEDNGFVEEKTRIEMVKDLSNLADYSLESTIANEFDVVLLDLSNHAAVAAFYKVLKTAFGSHPPSFDAWKIHYAQQPRFAPELTFGVKKCENNEFVAAIAVERIVDGEGGGDNEGNQVFVTHGKLLAHKEAGDADEEVQRLQDTVRPYALLFSRDFDERKLKITQQATTAYVCGIATLPEYRSKGLASTLLQTIFREAAKSPTLERVTLGTDVVNSSAMRTYARARMVEGERSSMGTNVVKQVAFIDP